MQAGKLKAAAMDQIDVGRPPEVSSWRLRSWKSRELVGQLTPDDEARVDARCRVACKAGHDGC